MRALQRNCQLTTQELSEELGLSPSQIGRRRQRLEQQGIIAGYRATLSPERVGLGVEAFVQVVMATHRPDAAQDFVRLVEASESVIAGWTMTGEADYLLRIMCTDLAALNTLIHATLLPHAAVARVQSQIVMHRVKHDAPLPLS